MKLASRAEVGADVKGLPKPKGLRQLLCDGIPLIFFRFTPAAMRRTD